MICGGVWLFFVMYRKKRYCLILNNHLSRALKLRSDDNSETQAEFIRKWLIIGILSDINRLDTQAAQFVLSQIELAIKEMTDEELSPSVKKRLLEILTPMLNGAG
jgi:hypothetical protein